MYYPQYQRATLTLKQWSSTHLCFHLEKVFEFATEDQDFQGIPSTPQPGEMPWLDGFLLASQFEDVWNMFVPPSLHLFNIIFWQHMSYGDGWKHDQRCPTWDLTAQKKNLINLQLSNMAMENPPFIVLHVIFQAINPHL